MALPPTKSLLALDYGQRRIGVAIASLDAKLPSPHTTVDNDSQSLTKLTQLALDNNCVGIVLGLPRDVKGHETDQTKQVRQFAKQLGDELKLAVYLQDEALTSHKAQQELGAKGLEYNKGSVDALAAVYILEDFLTEHPNINHEI